MHDHRKAGHAWKAAGDLAKCRANAREAGPRAVACGLSLQVLTLTGRLCVRAVASEVVWTVRMGIEAM